MFHLEAITRMLGCAPETVAAAGSLEAYYRQGLPYPVSHPLWRMGLDDEGEIRALQRPEQLWVGWLFQSYENLLRLTSLSLVMDYLLSHRIAPLSEQRQRVLNDALEDLRHPSLGRWKAWLDTILKALAPKGPIVPLLSDFPDTWGRLKASAGELVQLRNSLNLAHGTRGLSPDHLQAILREGFDLYLPLLEQARWFEGRPFYLLHQPIERPAEVSAFRLDGPRLGRDPSAQPLDLAFDYVLYPEAVWDFGAFEFVLLDTARECFQPLAPLVVHRHGLDYQLDLLVRDRVQVYAGDTGRRVLYTGMGYIQDKLFSQDNLETLGALFRLRRIAVEEMSVERCGIEDLADRCRHRAEAFIRQQEYDVGYDPVLFTHRTDIAFHLGQFLAGPEPGMLLAGPSGIGKSWEICHWVVEHLNANKPPEEAVLPVPLYATPGRLPVGIQDPASLMEAVMGALQLRGRWRDWRRRLLALRDSEAEPPWRGQLLIILEAINQYEGAQKALYGAIQQLLAEVAEQGLKGIKILYTSREEYLPGFFVAGVAKEVLPDPVLHYHDREYACRDPRGRVKAWLTLERWQQPELAKAYGSYQAKGGPITPWAAIQADAALITLLSHPYWLRLANQGLSRVRVATRFGAHRPIPGARRSGTAGQTRALDLGRRTARGHGGAGHRPAGRGRPPQTSRAA